MFDKMKELWDLKKKADEIKKELESLKFTSEDSYFSITINGTLEVESVSIKNLENKEKLEKSIKENTNKVIKNAQIETAKKTFGNITW
jgi:DNA-binding protein YbaB